MLFGNRGPRSSAARRRGVQPRIQTLEERQLLSIDLGGVLPPGQPNIATQPFGVAEAGAEVSGAAGFSVTAVGDVNGDGFDDFVVGAPTGVIVGGQLQPGSGNNSRAYLIFGSRSVNAGNVDWLTLDTTGQRLGDLGQLNNANQTNPISGQAGFAYSGLTFLTGSTNASQVGASVAALGDVNGDGFNDFMIGAPGANDLNNLNPNTGRAYLVYGGTSLNSVTSGQIDLDNIAGSGVSIMTLGSTLANSRLGLSMGRLGNFFASNSTSPDIAVAAPNASLAGSVSNGAVYAIPGSLIAAANSNIVNLTGIGNGLGGVTFAGSTTGEQIGLSVAGPGSVSGQLTGANVPIDDLLIGAPNALSVSGEAFLVYGGNALPGASTNVNGTNVILTSRIGGTGTNAIVGAFFQGVTAGRSGFAVSGIGDYNGDGFNDIAIGSPFAGSSAGQVDIFYGQTSTGTTLVGTIPLSSIPATVASLTLTGSLPGSLAGYSISAAGKIGTGGSGNDFIVGSPGLNGNQGGAYYIPANTFFLRGVQSLAGAEGPALAATLIQLTNTPSGASFLGSSVSGRFVSRTQTNTADADLVPDFILGAANWSATTTGRSGAGGVFIMEGAKLPVQSPVNTAIQTVIGVDTSQVGPGPFVVSATSPASMQIFVTSNTSVSPIFDPFNDIDTSVVFVNGVPFQDVQIAQTADLNNDQIPDAVITITPRSRLNLNSTITNLTVSGSTNEAIPRNWAGSALITVSGGSNPVTPGSVSGAIQVGTILPSSFTPHFGPDVYVPPTSALSRLNYKAIPRAVAYQQYMPGKGWAQRLYNFAHPNKRYSRVPTGTVNSLRGKLPLTLDSHVFSRGKFHKKEAIQFRHKGPVIPTNRQTERFIG